MDGRPLPGLCLLLVGCVPADDLADYSAGSVPSAGSSTPLPSPAQATADPGDPGDPGGSMSEDGGSIPASSEAETPAAPALDPVRDAAADTSEGALDEEEQSSAPPADAAPPTPAPAVGDVEPAPLAMQVRFVRLVADSAAQGGPFTSMAEFNVLDAARTPIDRSGWVARADSEETVYAGGAAARFAIDGQAGSVWHTAWFQQNPAPAHPHTLEIDMGEPHEVTGFRYLPRQDGSLDGSVGAFRFFVSADGLNWGEPIVAGTLASSTSEQQVELP